MKRKSSWSLSLKLNNFDLSSYRRLKIEQELQTDGLSEAERRAVVDDYERRELDYTRLQRQRLCMATLEAVKEAART